MTFDHDFRGALFGGEMRIEAGKNGPMIWTRLSEHLACPDCGTVYDTKKKSNLTEGSRCQRIYDRPKPKNSHQFSEVHGQPTKLICTGSLERVGAVTEKVPISEISQAIAHERGEETNRGRSLYFKWFTKKGADIRRKKLEEKQ